MAESTREWVEGQSSADYRDYDKTMAKLKAATLESQIASGSAWIGTPDEIRAQVARMPDLFGAFEHASLQINFGNMNVADAQRSMRLFAKDVMPAFSRQPVSAGRDPRAAQG
jgi:endonuclease IV